jgi:hypothetical protein
MFEFVKQSCVPYLVKGLTDVNEGRVAEAVVLQIVVDFVNYSVQFFDGSLFCSKSELMGRD